ncbi:MAG TPA: DegV family protein [Thermomicrobiales bacterium]|nr:DegV family protein [Thermomicrobiales bacterium]
MEQPPRVAVVTDSTADLTPEVAARYGITVVPLNVHFGQQSFRDQIDLSTDEFMTRLTTADKLPTTSQPSVGVFESAFRALARTHDEIIAVLISSRLSGTVQSAQLAADAVTDDIQVEIVDSLNVSYALGLQAIRAAELAAAGHSAAEIAATLHVELSSYHLVFFVETLEHLRRGGRIGKAAQLVGSILNLKPLLRMDEGQVVPFERTRTRKKALAALVEFAREMQGIEHAAVIYNTTPEDAQALVAEISSLSADPEVPIVQFGPVIATHIGPDVVGLAIKEATGG